MNYFTQGEVVDNTINDYSKKASYPIGIMFLYGIMAGMFIAIGAQGSILASHSISNTGIAKTVAGLVFPVGLMLIVLVGGQLFTGNCLLFMAGWDKRISWGAVAKNLAVIWSSNLIGAGFIATLCYFSGQFDFNSGALGAYIIKNAVIKANVNPLQAFISGILCNIIVCAAILVAASAKDVAGKIAGVFFTIFVFVISGFEHCIANAFYFPAGLLASKNREYVNLAKEMFHISQEQIDTFTVTDIFTNNMIPVTIGNVVGGGIIISGIIYLCHRKK